jgi:hypothetical protein
VVDSPPVHIDPNYHQVSPGARVPGSSGGTSTEATATALLEDRSDRSDSSSDGDESDDDDRRLASSDNNVAESSFTESSAESLADSSAESLAESAASSDLGPKMEPYSVGGDDSDETDPDNEVLGGIGVAGGWVI